MTEGLGTIRQARDEAWQLVNRWANSDEVERRALLAEETWAAELASMSYALLRHYDELVGLPRWAGPAHD